MRHLTHRAVDAAAGLPVGSTSNRFRTREALLVGVLRRILQRETTASTGLAMEIRTGSIEAVAATVGKGIQELSDAGRVLTQARRAVFVEAGNQPILREEIVRAQQELSAWMAPLLAELGSSDPWGHVPHLLALIEGLLGNQLVTRAPDFDPATAVAALLRGLIGTGPAAAPAN
jgi:AcrR family transcriptional regulator